MKVDKKMLNVKFQKTSYVKALMEWLHSQDGSRDGNHIATFGEYRITQHE